MTVPLGKVGRTGEAYRAARQAVWLYRRLVAAELGAFEADLAAALHNLAIAHRVLGRLNRALQATRDAVELWRPLARTRPDLHRADLVDELEQPSVSGVSAAYPLLCYSCKPVI